MVRTKPIAAAAVLAIGISVGLTIRSTATEEPQFCNAYGIIRGAESGVATFNDVVLLVGEPTIHRDPCNGDDLWHYMTGDLDGVDGVLFDDCIISWTAGGRTTAEAEGIPC